jgi:hypothetical protein
VRGVQLAVLAPDLGVALAIRDHVGVGHQALELGVALLDLLDELLDHGVKCDGRARRNGIPIGHTRRRAKAA